MLTPKPLVKKIEMAIKSASIALQLPLIMGLLIFIVNFHIILCPVVGGVGLLWALM